MRRAGLTGAAFLAVAVLCLLPGTALAQSAFTGVVKDDTGAVLPGVTVEAASPALIEKSKSAVTDGNGAYRLVDLRPGVYTVTFSLPGFSTVKREGIELPSNFTMTMNSEMKVGALEETVTVSGASPVVDVQSTTKSQVLIARSPRRGADRPHDPGDGAAHHRRVAELARRRRLARDAADLHVGARRRRVADDRAGRRPDGQRPRRRRRGAELLQQLDEPGNGLHDQRRRRPTSRAAACG